MRYPSQYLQLGALEQLKGLEIKAKLIVEGFLSGLHRSPYQGFSVEFSEHRPYFPGDALKNVDWKVFARSERLFVKKFQEETNLKAYLILDTSNSMGFGLPITKFEYSCYLTASLAYLLIQQKDAAGLTMFSDRIKVSIPPRSKKNHLYYILSALSKKSPEGKTNISKVLFKIAPSLKKRGLIVIISDLLDNQMDVLKAVKALRAKKNEVIVFHILDRSEMDFTFSKPTIFIDLETNEKLTVEPAVVRKYYKNAIANLVKKYKENFLENNIDYETIITDEPFNKALYRFFSKRNMLK